MFQAGGSLPRVLRQVTHKGEVLTIEPAGGQGQEQRHWAHQRHHANAQIVCGPHHRAARVGHSGHARFAHQAHIVPLQGCCQQWFAIKARLVVAFFVHMAGQFGDALLGQRCDQWVRLAHTLEEGAGALGVLAHPMLNAGGGGQGGAGQHFGDRGLLRAAKVEWRGHQKQAPWCGLGGVHNSFTPAWRNMRAVRIKGSPIKAVGSSLSMDSSRAMPKPSLLALPAQS